MPSVLQPGKSPRTDVSAAHHPGRVILLPSPTDPAAAPTTTAPPPRPGLAGPAGAPHLRMLHDLPADAEGVQPLLESRTQLGAGHSAVVAWGRACVGGSAGHPWRVRRKCREGLRPPPEPQGRCGRRWTAPSRCASPCTSGKTARADSLAAPAGALPGVLQGGGAFDIVAFPNPASGSYAQHSCHLTRTRPSNDVQFKLVTERTRPPADPELNGSNQRLLTHFPTLGTPVRSLFRYWEPPEGGNLEKVMI